MSKLLAPFAVLAGFVLLAAPAQAARLPIAIPTGETVVKVLDLPDIEALHRHDGAYVDLGYHFKSLGGEWVGYVGRSDKYLPLEADQALALARLGGHTGLPPVPQRPIGSWLGSGSHTILFGVGIIMILFKVLSWLAGLARRGRPDEAGEAEAGDDHEFAPPAKLDRAMEEAARRFNRSETTLPPLRPASPVVQRFSGAEPRSVFGKRV